MMKRRQGQFLSVVLFMHLIVGGIHVDARGGELTVTTDFDSGGGAEVTVHVMGPTGDPRADKHIEITLTDPQGYGAKGYMHFRVDDGAGKTVLIEFANLGDSRMTEDHKLLYTTDLESLDWQRMESEIGDGFVFELPADRVYVSNYHAYPYGHIVNRVNQLAEHEYVEVEVIGQSHEGRDMHALRIADSEVDPAEALDYVMITRQHPGEVHGSWHMDAAIDYVLEVLDDPDRRFEDDFVFHIVPAANPDGIYHGIHRHDTQGNDLNRRWHSESPVEIANMKNYLREHVSNVHWGFDFHASTNQPFRYPAIWYDERAVGDDELEIVNMLVEASKSFDVANATASDRRSRGFIYDAFEGVMVSTEVSTYWPGHSRKTLREEGRAFIQATLTTVPE